MVRKTSHGRLQILDGDSFLLKAMGSGLWPAMVLLSEIVQTFILADFWCAWIAPLSTHSHPLVSNPQHVVAPCPPVP